MPESQIKLYYKNVTAEIIGSEHGITDAQLKTFAEKTSPVISQLNKERKEVKTPYRNLPYNKKNIQQVKKLTSELKDRCENLGP